jgi:hypothetical protein
MQVFHYCELHKAAHRPIQRDGIEPRLSPLRLSNAAESDIPPLPTRRALHCLELRGPSTNVTAASSQVYLSIRIRYLLPSICS